MLIDKIIGHKKIVEHLKYSVDNQKVSHAQMFVGPEGSGVLETAIAYAQYVLCSNSKSENCKEKNGSFTHPDLHFVYPVNNNSEVKSKAISKNFSTEWNEFINDYEYPNILDWYEKIGIEKKAGLISVNEAEEIVRSMSLKSYEGDYKVMIIWMPELMNIPTANKLLKIIEEPVGKSLFLFVTENEEQIIGTIKSRSQAVYFNRLSDEDVKSYLVEQKGMSIEKASDISTRCEGNIRAANDLLKDGHLESQYQGIFVDWVRASFKADTGMLVGWAEEMAKMGKQFQLNFLKYSSRVFRQALLENYEAKELSFLKVDAGGFKFDNFIKFVHGQNIHIIMHELDEGIFHIERNGNAKIVLLDLSLKITRGLHVKYKQD